MEIEKRVNEKESRREAARGVGGGGGGGGTEREFYVFEIAFPTETAAEKFVNATQRE